MSKKRTGACASKLWYHVCSVSWRSKNTPQHPLGFLAVL